MMYTLTIEYQDDLLFWLGINGSCCDCAAPRVLFRTRILQKIKSSFFGPAQKIGDTVGVKSYGRGIVAFDVFIDE